MANEFGVDVPEHTLLSRLGRGGMASVYLARDETLGRLVAVKIIDERFESDSRFQQRFEREARTAAGLTHPNIVPVYRYGSTADHRPYLTMAYLDGGNLRQRLLRRGALPVEEALAITRQVASALLVAHGRNIVHRDLKPDNVLFQGGGLQGDSAFLTDFGIAKLLDASTALTGTGANPGTVKYFSPEQAQELPVDQRSDIYTLGVVLYEMLTGASPIDGETLVQLIVRIAQVPPAPLPARLRGLQPFMDVLLAKDPDQRLGSCADVVAIVNAMERNWLRYGAIDRLTDGVVITLSAPTAPRGRLGELLEVGSMEGAAREGHAALVACADAVTAPGTAATDPLAPRRPFVTISDQTPAANGDASPPPSSVDMHRMRVAAAAADTLVAPTSMFRGAVVGSDAGGWAFAARWSRLCTVTRTTWATGAGVGLTAALLFVCGWYFLPERARPIVAPLARTPSAPLALAAVDAVPSLVMLPHQRATTLLVAPEPADAQVQLVEVATPYSPHMVVAPGPVRLHVTRPGYVPKDVVLDVRARMTNAFGVQLQRSALPEATLRIATVPADAAITFPESTKHFRNGMQLPVGRMLVRVERVGFQPQERHIDLRGGDNRVVFALDAEPTAVALNNDSNEARVSSIVGSSNAGNGNAGNSNAGSNAGSNNVSAPPTLQHLASTDLTPAQRARLVQQMHAHSLTHERRWLSP